MNNTLRQHWRRNFVLIYIGQTVSLFTSSIAQYALLWYITDRTGSAASLSLATLLGFLPTALFSPFIGSFVDRYDRKKIMIIADGSIALLGIGLALIAILGDGELPMGPIMIALFFRAVGSAFHQPCLQAVTPQIVPDDMLAKCNGYTSAFQSFSMVFSPAVAAFLFAVVPIGPLILLDAVGAAVGIITIFIAYIPAHTEVLTEKLHVLRDAADGLRVLRKNRGLFLLVILSALVGLAIVPVSGLYPLMSMEYFGGTAVHAGIVESLFSVGMLLGSLILGVWGGTKNKMWTLLPSVWGSGLAMAGMGLLPPSGFVPFVVLSFIFGFLWPYFNTMYMTIIQEQIPEAYLGRVIGLSLSIMTLAAPVGLALSGAFAEQLGIDNWFTVCGILTIIAGVAGHLIPSVRNLDKDIERKIANRQLLTTDETKED